LRRRLAPFGFALALLTSLMLGQQIAKQVPHLRGTVYYVGLIPNLILGTAGIVGLWWIRRRWAVLGPPARERG